MFLQKWDVIFVCKTVIRNTLFAPHNLSHKFIKNTLFNISRGVIKIQTICL